MTTDRTAAHALVVDWTGRLRTGMDGAMRASSSFDSDTALYGVHEILTVLVRVPLMAEKPDDGEADEDSGALATLVAVCRSRERFAKAFTRVGRRALQARKTLAAFVPVVNTGDFYEAALALLEEMKQLAEMLRVRNHIVAGNVAQLFTGPSDPIAESCIMRIREWIESLASAMGSVMKADNFGYASRPLGRIEPIVEGIAGVPYAARSGSTLEGIEPLVEVFRRGGKVKKALERCAKVAGTCLTECRDMISIRELTRRDELNAAVLVLLSELERLVEVVGRQPAA